MARFVNFVTTYALLFLCSNTFPQTLSIRLWKQKNRLTSNIKESKSFTPLKPVIWLHIPKTGTSFINTLLHHPDICPNFPADAYMMPGHHGIEHKFLGKFNLDTVCPGGFARENRPPGHHGVGLVYDQNKGHVVTFFRQPKKRLYSAWNYGQHSWPRPTKAKTIQEFASVVGGCQTRMLVRGDARRGGAQGAAICGGKSENERPVSEEEKQLAIQRVNEMNFVGITEQYDLSLCLFHKIHGGQCLDREFSNTRKGKYRTTVGLEDFKDVDDPLYEVALAKFWSLMEKHGADRPSCEKLCSNMKNNPFSLAEEGKIALTKGSQETFRYDWPGRQEYDVDWGDEEE